MATDGPPPPYPGVKDPYAPAPAAPYPPNNAPYPPPPQQSAYPSGPGYPAATGYPPTTGVTNVYTMQQPQPQPVTTVVVTGRGTCPNCRVGNLVESFTCCGIMCAIFFFPLGLLCCLLMRQSVCTHCHAVF